MSELFTTFSDSFLTPYKTKVPNFGFDGFGYIVYKRTYARTIPDITSTTGNRLEEWWETIKRCIEGAQKIGAKYTIEEAQKLFDHMFNFRGLYSGRMLWQLGTNTVDRFGANSLLACWYVSIKELKAFDFIFENLMLGGGVGYSIRKEHVHELPKVKKNVKITHLATKDADFIVPDKREGWVKLLHNVLESYCVTGIGFSYSTILIREYGSPINGFGGSASGPGILIDGITKICNVLKSREGKKLRSIDVLDIVNIIGSIVVAGNVRRSAQIAIGDPDDFLFIRAKRWDLGNIPNWRAMSNNSIDADSFEQISDDIWKGYEGNGEPYGFINTKLMQKYGRLGEKIDDDCEGCNPCVPAGTQILTDIGYVNIEDVIDTKVNVWNGKEFSEVVPKVTGKNQKLVKVDFSSGQSLVCTTYHNFPIIENYNGSYNMKQAKDLEPGDKLLKCEYPILKDGESIDENVAYTQGFFSAEGMENYNFIYVYSPKYNCIPRLSSLSISSEYIDRVRVKFDTNDIINNKSFVPFSWSLNSRLNWLSGLIDGDGTLCVDGQIQVTSVNYEFLKNVQKMLTLCGVDSKVTLSDNFGYRIIGKNEYYCQSCYRLLISAKQVQTLYNVGMKCERLDLSVVNPNRDATRYKEVLSVTELDTMADTVYCFTENNRHMGCFEGLVTGQCGEISLESFECCNLSEYFLNNIESKEQLIEIAQLLFKTQKAVCLLPFIHKETEKIVRKNMRVGISASGICQVLNKVDIDTWMDDAYKALRKFDKQLSKEWGCNESIKISTEKPSGTLSLLAGATPGMHGGIYEFFLRRIRISSDNPLIEQCRKLGFTIEDAIHFDGSIDRTTKIICIPNRYEKGTILVKDMTAIDQLNLLKRIQTKWADNSVSVTIYYKKEELPEIKEWMNTNYEKSVKTVSFLLHSDHGFKQAPYEEITEKEYNELKKKIKPISSLYISTETLSGDVEIGECQSGVCPIK